MGPSSAMVDTVHVSMRMANRLDRVSRYRTANNSDVWASINNFIPVAILAHRNSHRSMKYSRTVSPPSWNDRTSWLRSIASGSLFITVSDPSRTSSSCQHHWWSHSHSCKSLSWSNDSLIVAVVIGVWCEWSVLIGSMWSKRTILLVCGEEDRRGNGRNASPERSTELPADRIDSRLCFDRVCLI